MGQHVPFTIQFMSHYEVVDGSSHVLIAFADFFPCECLLLIGSFLVIVLFALNLVGCFLDWSVCERVN